MRRATCMTMLSPTEAARDRPGAEARLLPGSPPPTVSLGPPSGNGRSKDYMRQGLCRSALRGGRKPLICTFPAGQRKAPGPDQFRRPGETPGNAGKRAVMPISDPALRGGESKLPSPSAVERRRRTENTHTTPTAIPARLIRHSRGVGNPSLLNNHPQLRNSPRPLSVIPSLLPSTELEAEVGAVLLSPSPFPLFFPPPLPLYRPGRRVTVVRGDR